MVGRDHGEGLRSGFDRPRPLIPLRLVRRRHRRQLVNQVLDDPASPMNPQAILSPFMVFRKILTHIDVTKVKVRIFFF